MLWGVQKATKKQIKDFLSDNEIEPNDDIKEDVKKEKKKKQFIEGDDYSIDDLEMLNKEYERLTDLSDALYSENKYEEAEINDEKIEKLNELIEGLEAFKKMRGKGFKKGSKEALEHSKKMREMRKTKTEVVVEKTVKKEKGKPYYFIGTIPKGYREATEDEAIRHQKVGSLGKYQIDNTKYELYLNYKILISPNNDDGTPKTVSQINTAMLGLKTRINKLLKKVEVEKNKKEKGKDDRYDEFNKERKMVNAGYNWYNKLVSEMTDKPYKKMTFKYEYYDIEPTGDKDDKKDKYEKPIFIDPRTGRPETEDEDYEEITHFKFKNGDNIFTLNKNYFNDDIIIKNKYAKKLLKKGIVLMPEHYDKETIKELFGEFVGGSLFTLDGLKKAFSTFSPFSVVGVVSNLDDNVGEYPKYVSDIIDKYGDNTIVKITIGRTPIQKTIDKLMNVLMLGKLEKRKQKLGYDDLFHLRLIAHLDNGTRVSIEKNERINMTLNEGRRKEKNEEFREIEDDVNVTLNELLEGAKRIQGAKYYKYSASVNNCQDYVLALLQGSNIGNQEDYNFVKQDVKSLFKKYGYMKKIQDKVTNLAGKFNQLIYGGRIKMKTLGKPFRSAIKKSGIKGAVNKAVVNTGLAKGYDKLQGSMTNLVSKSNEKTVDPTMKTVSKSAVNPFNNNQFTKLGRDAGDLTWHYMLPAAVQAGKHLYDATAATASTMLTGNPYAGKKTADYLWDTMVADEGNDLRQNQKSELLGKIADEAGKAGAKALTGNMKGSGTKRKRGRPRKYIVNKKSKKPIEVVIKTPLEYERFSNTANPSLKQYLEGKRISKEKNLQSNINDMANYIKNDVDNVKRELQQLKNERDFYKGAVGAGVSKGNKWINHCKEYAKKHNVSYKDAIKLASATYKK